LRSVVFRFEDITAFSLALGEAARGSLPLPDGETVTDGEWVLATFEIGSRRRATAAAARGVRAAGDTHLAFERRDWERLVAFVAARSEHMRAARPASSPSLPGNASSPAPAPSPPPIPAAPLSRREETEPPPSSTLESSRIPFGARILLVDDDQVSRDQVRRMLAEIGLLVEVVENTAQAAAKMQLVAYDALVLDSHAPSRATSPLEFVRTLRKDPQRSPLPVLFLSDHSSSRDVVDAFASGADDFLPRPFRASELGARVFGLLRRARFARSSSISPRSGEGGSIP